jgi:hypothetical protein
MKSRPEEMSYYEEQYERIRSDPLLAGGVTFEPHGDDMASFYGGIGFALSVSDFESFHLTLADGAASRALPLSLDWEGADRIYPPQWIRGSIESMACAIREATSRPWREVADALQKNANYCRDRFGFEGVSRALDAHCFKQDS